MQTRISFSKMRRDEIRTETADSNVLNELIKESQFQKAELKRIKDKWKQAISEIDSEIQQVQNKISELKTLRARMSDNLQKWIFENALVHNAHGESTTIWDLFQNQGLTPPGGTGDCAAPKLLEYAYKNGLRPLAMGEFWYGKSPETAVRTHGHFYPSCTSKCGPLLGYMTMGLNIQEDIKITSQSPIIIHEDESIIIVEKPSGMPSVPGLNGRLSLQEWLNSREDAATEVAAVHRLDMDTSGVMIFAKTRDAEINLKKQFEEHTVRKTYIARLTGRPPQSADLESPEPQGIRHDSIDLPLSADYDERPRQKVDFKQGKPAYTEYEIVKENPDGTADILLHPHTGRTHQLRVHCAHTLGLARPIVGDLLYGGHSAYNKEGRNVNRLCLHALSINFLHPVSNSPMEFISEKLTFSLEE
jgi:tRNA pseudouridine32 synthase/23S rRNA pseudouridine746 synthase